MQLSDFEYELPDDLIAQRPAERREASRMLVVDRANEKFEDDRFKNFPSRLNAGDVIVLNNTRVFPARLLGVSDTGASVEVFLIEKIAATSWRALARPAKRLKIGRRVQFGEMEGTIVENREGSVVVEFTYDGDFDEILERVGRTPLPPYIKRNTNERDQDRERYQTVYARSSGAIAAPTAGLHFTAGVLDQIRSMDVEVAEITLHVGYGTFEPVRSEDLSRHTVLPERYEIDPSVADTLNRARDEHRRIIAIGTTTTRALESALAKSGRFVGESGLADLTITPGYRFQAVDALLTNFHLPRSSLLVLVSTFAGHELIMKAYEHAVAERYRFYSYGDCMFIG